MVRTEFLQVRPSSSCYFFQNEDGCTYRDRRISRWVCAGISFHCHLSRACSAGSTIDQSQRLIQNIRLYIWIKYGALQYQLTRDLHGLGSFPPKLIHKLGMRYMNLNPCCWPREQANKSICTFIPLLNIFLAAGPQTEQTDVILL